MKTLILSGVLPYIVSFVARYTVNTEEERDALQRAGHEKLLAPCMHACLPLCI